MKKEEIIQILKDNSQMILDYKDETYTAVEYKDFDKVADAILLLLSVSNRLMVKNWAESREATARVREQIAIERFIEVYYDGEDDLTFEDVNKRLRLH